MHSKNKKRQDDQEREHVGKVKASHCVICGKAGPSEAHEIEQGLWFLSVSLCPECHRGKLGIHGDKTMWRIFKMTELKALNETLRNIL